MPRYFEQGQFEPFAYQRLNDIIANHRKDPDTPVSDRDYVVFDFDHTTAIFDVEDNLMMYMLDFMLYRMRPADFYHALTDGPFDLDLPLIEGQDQLTARNLADDIIGFYQYFYEAKITNPETSLDMIVQTNEYQTFSAKLRFFYNHVKNLYTRQPGEPWLTYWFAGYDEESFKKLAQDMVKHATKQPIKKRVWSSHPDLPGKAGVVTAEFEQGLVFPQEIKDLYQAFHDNQIETYIISASPEPLVRAVAEEVGYPVAEDQIIGMKIQLNREGILLAVLSEDSYVTKQAGKTAVIRDIIQPRQEGKKPIALFGDSLGDYHMMETFKDSALSFLFNRYENNETQDLVKEAVDSYEQADARVVLQGRDENKGVLIPSQKTIPLGQTESVLFYKDLKS